MYQMCFSAIFGHIYSVISRLSRFQIRCQLLQHSPEATVTQRLIWKRGVSKRGILKSLVSHVLNFKSWIKLIYDKIAFIFCVIHESNPTFEVQNLGNKAFQIPCLEMPHFQMRRWVTVASGLSLSQSLQK